MRHKRVLVAATTVLAVLAGGGGIAPAQADSGPGDPVNPAALAGAADDSDLADVLGCNRPPSPAAAAELFSTGTMRLVPFGAVKLPVDGNIDWAINPFNHASWESRFRDLRWLDLLVDVALDPGTAAGTRTAYLARVETIVQDWIADNPRTAAKPLKFSWSPPSAVALRASFLLCATRAFPGAVWLDAALRAHARQLTARWTGAWNHGTAEAITLYRIGCRISDAAARRTARTRLLKSFEPNRLGPVLDGQGVTNEQAVGYADVVLPLWNEAIRLMRACGDSVPSVVRNRVAKIPEFLTAATQPDGTLVQLGDTYARSASSVGGPRLQYAVSRGAAGKRPKKRVWVYSRGYVFGRSGWGEVRPFGAESFYSLRFGDRTRLHGHDDRMSMTYYARGTSMIVDSGHIGYQAGSYRRYLHSTAAHNVLEVQGAKYRNVATRLSSKRIRNTWQSFGLRDRAYGVQRTRNVLFAQRPDIAVVYDRTARSAKKRTFRQLWHLAADLRVTRKERGVAVASSPGGTRLWLIPVSLDGSRRGEGTSVVTGRTSPTQGWVSERMLERSPAPVVTMTSRGRAARMVTVLVPTAPGSTVKTATKRLAKGARLLTVTVDGRSYRFRIAAGGTLTRV